MARDKITKKEAKALLSSIGGMGGFARLERSLQDMGMPAATSSGSRNARVTTSSPPADITPKQLQALTQLMGSLPSWLVPDELTTMTSAIINLPLLLGAMFKSVMQIYKQTSAECDRLQLEALKEIQVGGCDDNAGYMNAVLCMIETAMRIKSIISSGQSTLCAKYLLKYTSLEEFSEMLSGPHLLDNPAANALNALSSPIPAELMVFSFFNNNVKNLVAQLKNPTPGIEEQVQQNFPKFSTDEKAQLIKDVKIIRGILIAYCEQFIKFQDSADQIAIDRGLSSDTRMDLLQQVLRDWLIKMSLHPEYTKENPALLEQLARETSSIRAVIGGKPILEELSDKDLSRRASAQTDDLMAHDISIRSDISDKDRK